MTTPAQTQQTTNGTSASKPLGSTPPPQADPKTTPPAQEAKTDPPPAATTEPSDKPNQQPTQPKGALSFVSSAEDIDKLLGDGKDTNAVMPRSAIKKIKDKFEERGKTAGQAELLKQLEAQGFKSVEEVLLAANEAKRLREEAEAAKAAGANKDPKRASFLPPRGKDKDAQAAALAQTEAEKKLAEARRDAANERRKREELEAKVEAERAEMAMRSECVSADVKSEDVDYVLDKLRSHIGGLDEAGLASFDQAKWFDNMRKEKPYLFRGTQVPATTGVSSPNNVPPAPKPPEVTAAAATESVKDARKMTKEEWRQHKEKLGVRKSGLS